MLHTLRTFTAWLIIGLFPASILSVNAQEQQIIPLENLISPQDMRKTGLAKLSPSERAVLEKLLTQLLLEAYMKGFQDAVAAQSALSESKTYPSTNIGHWVRQVADGGALVILEDNSIWHIYFIDRIYTSLWLPTHNIIVLNAEQPVGDFKYILVNTDTGEQVYAKYLGKQ